MFWTGARLDGFKSKREAWLSCLNGNDHHSIWKQMSALLWDYALFQTLRGMQQEAAENPTAEVGFNMPVLRMLEAGFAVTQATGIRRLTEKQWKNPSKRVISLRALVDDIKENRELLTREVYLGCHALPYDPAPAKDRCFARIAASGQTFFYEGLDTNGEEAWCASERAHELFDKLSETTPASRSRGDLVSQKWFDSLDEEIKRCEDVCILTDKFIAHAADPVSRADLKEEQSTLSLSKLAECHKAALQVVSFVSGPLLQDSTSTGVPVPQFDVLANLDKAWVTTKDLEKVRTRWQHQLKEIENWSQTSMI